MAKNNQMLAYMKFAKPIMEHQLCDVYAAFGLALDEIGIPSEQINSLCAMTQEYWRIGVENGWDMAEWCYRQTGIDVRLEVNKHG